MKTYPFRKSVNRVLVVRLSFAAAVIAGAVGLITYGLQQSQLERQDADLGRQGVSLFLEKTRFVLEQKQTDSISAIREVLEHDDPPYRAVRFVYAQFQDKESAVFAEKSVADQPHIDGVRPFVASLPFPFPEPEKDDVWTAAIGDAS